MVEIHKASHKSWHRNYKSQLQMCVPFDIEFLGLHILVFHKMNMSSHFSQNPVLITQNLLILCGHSCPIKYFLALNLYILYWINGVGLLQPTIQQHKIEPNLLEI